MTASDNQDRMTERRSDQIPDQNQNKKAILNHTLYLYLTEFFAGMSVMAVELGASRLLAPYFSSSQIVWTIIIGTIMIAMALGNIWGGRTADKDPNPDRLYRRILIAAVWIAAIPLLGKYIILLITGVLIVTISSNLLIWAAFLACMIIFVFPLFLLGTVTPSLVKYSVDSLDHNGRTVGYLGAFNTIGSIIGTFVPTFVTIPAVGTSVTFLIFSGILLLIGGVYFLTGRGGKKTLAISTVLFIVFSLLGHSGRFAFWDDSLTYEGESIYNYLQVRDQPDMTILSTNVLFGVQSVRMKNDNLTGMYYDYALAAPVLAGAGQKGHDSSLLVLGMGSGTFASQCARYFPGMKVEGVEIDQKITDLAHRYFALPESVKVTTYDGRAFLNASRQKYDIIMVDAYQDITIPFQMSSVEFFSLVKDHLNPGGVMVVNMNMHTDEAGNINEWLSDTIASVFDQVYTVDVVGSTNRELLAFEDSRMRAGMKEKIQSLEDDSLRAMMVQVDNNLEAYEGSGHIFTDDRAPVELMGMKVIDSLIQDELGYYKDVYRREGLPGLLHSF